MIYNKNIITVTDNCYDNGNWWMMIVIINTDHSYDDNCLLWLIIMISDYGCCLSIIVIITITIYSIKFHKVRFGKARVYLNLYPYGDREPIFKRKTINIK